MAARLDPVKPTKWDERQQATRTKLISTARQLIANNGLDGLTIRKLAAEADVAVGTIYNHFGDRSGVLLAMVQDGLETLADPLGSLRQEEPLDSTRVLLASLLQRYESEERIWRPVFLALKSEPGDHGLGQSGERLLAFILEDLRSAQKADMFVAHPDLETLARHLLDEQLGLLTRWAYGALTINGFREGSIRSFELSLAALLNEPNRSASLARSGLVSSPSPQQHASSSGT